MTQETRIGKHGHVVPTPNGFKARCGGPAICPVCQQEQAALRMTAPVSVKQDTEATTSKVYMLHRSCAIGETLLGVYAHEVHAMQAALEAQVKEREPGASHTVVPMPVLTSI